MPTHHNKSQLKTSPKPASAPAKTAVGQQPQPSALKRILLGWLPQRRWLKRLVLVGLSVVIIATGSMYGIARWYIYTESKQPLVMGVSFIPSYASYLGVEPQETMDALLQMGVRHFRLVSYWNELEPSPGQYDFSQLDWQFKKAEAAGAKITLAIGLRQPRWPECHMPDWAAQEPASVWQPQLDRFIEQTVQRYEGSASLESYQLENEYFNRVFGECSNFDRARLVREYNLTKKTDPTHKVIISRSNNGIGIPLYQPKPDEYGISIYKRVWDSGFSKRYLEYPFPAWYYGFLAGTQKLHDGNDMVIHELQAEAWAPNGKSILDIDLTEQNKSLNAARLKDRFEYGRATGMRQFDLWGAEYWYYRKQVLHDPSLWQVAQSEFANND